MIGYENTDFHEDQEQTALEPVAMLIPRFTFAHAFMYLGLAMGLLIGGCAPVTKIAPEPPYIAQRPGFTEKFLFGETQASSDIVIMRRAPAVEVTDSGYLRDLEAE